MKYKNPTIDELPQKGDIDVYTDNMISLVLSAFSVGNNNHLESYISYTDGHGIIIVKPVITSNGRIKEYYRKTSK